MAKVVIIFGATAVGKTDLIRLFANKQIEVISADSRQVYRGFEISTAYPPKSILAEFPHHFVAIKHFSQDYTVFDFVKETYRVINEIEERGNYPLVIGGAAFYLYHLWNGVPQTPPIDFTIRHQIRKLLQEKGQEYMFNQLVAIDPVYAATIDAHDSYRTLRGLEVFEQMGKPISDFDKCSSVGNTHQFLVLGISRTREVLYKRINRRVDSMIELGLIDEVYKLWKQGLCVEYNAGRTIGVREFLENTVVIDSWKNNTSPPSAILDEVIALIKRNSRRYAKRQLTFFKKFSSVQWFSLQHNGEEDRGTNIIVNRHNEKKDLFIDSQVYDSIVKLSVEYFEK